MTGGPGWSRRSVLRAGMLAASVGAGVPLAGCGGPPAAAGSGQTGRLFPSALPLPEPFTRPLPVPPVSRPVSEGPDGVRHRIVARRAELEILPGLWTPVLSYQGTVPGPTVVSRRGRPTLVEYVNRLGLPSVVHLHGGVSPADSDGFPTDLVLPEGTADAARHEGHTATAGHAGMSAPDPRADVVVGRRTYRHPMDQRAGLLWYHDHRMDFTGPMVYFGLYGLHVVRDDVEDDLPLPSGDRELPVILTDRSFEADGSFRYPSRNPTLSGEPGVTAEGMPGVLGDVLLVNGAPWPSVEVDAARYRLRLLNASNARRYTLRLDPPPPAGPAFRQIGSDVGLLSAPVDHDAITIAPAERFDVVVDFAAWPVGTRVTLRNTLGGGTTSQVMQFVVARRPAVPDPARVPAALAPEEDPPAVAGAIRRTFRFRRGTVSGHPGWTINDRPFDPTFMMAAPRAGSVEVWRFATDVHHSVHVHLGHFRVLSRGGRGPGPMDLGWKDTVDLRPVEYVDVAVRFPRLTGRYLMHCHNLEHEDMAMMAAFEVV